MMAARRCSSRGDRTPTPARTGRSSDESASRYARSSGSVEPIDSDTPWSTTGASARARSSAASGRPPAIMKFSEIASNQSTRAVPSQSRGKCGGRRPTPWPRYGTAIATGTTSWGSRRFWLHSAAVFVSTKLLPLQAFLPLQSLKPALLQLPWPLHALRPAHLTGSDCALSCAIACRLPPIAIVATAVAIMKPLLIGCIASSSPGWVCTARADERVVGDSRISWAGSGHVKVPSILRLL